MWLPGTVSETYKNDRLVLIGEREAIWYGDRDGVRVDFISTRKGSSQVGRGGAKVQEFQSREGVRPSWRERVLTDSSI